MPTLNKNYLLTYLLTYWIAKIGYGTYTPKMDGNISLNNKYMIYLKGSFLIHVLLITVCLRTYYMIIYYYYQCIDTSAGGLLVHVCIISPVVSVFWTYIVYQICLSLTFTVL